ncbi:MAG: ImcF-related family protein [Candidatus Acidiferrales bacterium]
MKLTWEYLAAAAAFVVTLLLAWFVSVWVHLQGANLVILRLGIVVLGVLCILGFLMWARGQKIPAATAVPGMPAVPAAPSASAVVAAIASDISPDDIDRLVREAEKKVAGSRLGKGAKLSGLPTIFVLGETASGKTSALLNSGLDPELLAGQMYQDGNVVPTSALNLWFARKSVFVEAAGKIAGDPKPWARLLHRLSPSRLQSIFGKNSQAPRAAVVCVDCEKLVKPASPGALVNAARMLRARLEEMAHQLGASFPVYVVFSKLDQVAYASEFMGSLRDEETMHVLGITLPVSATSGVYAEQETKRLSGAFNSLFSSLADCRTGLLSRERDKTKQPGIYEFPRQFRRLGKPAVEFLVELCRPSHLRSGPFLRGFYFAGRRMVASAAPSPAAFAAQTTIRPAQDFSANATTIMRAEDMPTMAQMAQAAAGTGTQFGTGTMIQSPSETRMVPQWVFLSHVFTHVVLQDRAAMGASGASTKVNSLRRLVFAAATAVCVILSIAFLISFLSNRSLESDVAAAVQGVRAGAASNGDLGSLQDWQALDALRQPLQQLSSYQRDGAPLHMRWGLYSGADVYARGRAVYFARFRQLFFDQTYNSLHSTLTALPVSPGPNDDYSAAYNPLKAYLIVSSHPEKSTREFVTPTLLKSWLAGRDLDDQRKQLVQQQLDFYADELKISNPYTLEADFAAIGKTHNYLAQFAATQRIYRSMLAAAAKTNPGLNFNRKYPDATSVVRDPYEVSGAFSKAGWNFMKGAVQHADQYTSGEEWVLGDQTQGGQHSAGNSAADLTAMYTKDYIQAWREFLNQATVYRGGSYQDQAQKLASLSGNRSPLLMLMCEASQNTAIDSPDVTKAFAPVQQVVPSPCQDQVIQPPSQNYVKALNAVQTCLEAVPPGLTGDALTTALAPCNALSGQARAAADQIAQGFAIDHDGKMDVRVKTLLEAPTGAAAAPPPPGPGGMEAMCSSLKGMDAKYPFNPAASQEVSLGDFVGFFQPGSGAFSKFLDQNKAIYELQNGQYVQKGGKPQPAVTALVNRAAGIQRALFPAGATAPQFKFIVKAHPQPEISSETLTIEGQPLKVAGNHDGEKAFVWSGAGGEASLSINGTSFGEFQGPWAAFRLFDYYNWTAGPTGYHLSWPVRGFGGQQAKINGKPLVAEFDLDSGNIPLFQRSYLTALKCPAH